MTNANVLPTPDKWPHLLLPAPRGAASSGEPEATGEAGVTRGAGASSEVASNEGVAAPPAAPTDLNAALDAGAFKGLTEAIRAELGDSGATVVATGGLATLIQPHSHTISTVDPSLTLRGIELILRRQRTH